jgi:NAD(P)-dependent dehydrogenase (short-subunit alcohol dehydrogenase family)
MQMPRGAVVTGSSSGIEFETSLTLAENNFRTYATTNLGKTLYCYLIDYLVFVE